MTVCVFVSSTWLDLQPERQAVEAALQRLRETKFVGMEYFGSRDETTQQASLAEVDRAQVYVGIFGGRYGSGITEDEYRRARALDLPCFAYCKDEGAIPTAGRETDPAKAARLATLKQDLRQAHTVTTFSNPDELAAHVTADLHRWLFDHYLAPRLERATRGELPLLEARSLLDAIRDWEALPPDLLRKLAGMGLVTISEVGNITLGGNVSESFIMTGSGNVITTGGINIMGDGNVVGTDNTVRVTKTTTAMPGATLPEFTTLLVQLRAALVAINFGEKARNVLLADVAAVEAEAHDVKPSLTTIEAKLRSIKVMTNNAENIGLTVEKLCPLIIEAIQYARRLFP